MIEKKTTLILGAGASAPYNYPLGIGLRNTLLDPDAGRDHIFEKLGLEPWETVRAVLHKSQLSCVDDFLKTYPQHAQAAKVAIAYELVKHEDVDDLLNPRRKDHWYLELLKLLGDDVSLGGGRLSIITFNYDLSLETYLQQTLIYRYNIDKYAAQKALRQLPIIHVYGSIGTLKGPNVDGRHYGSEQQHHVYGYAGNAISTCHEAASVEAVSLAKQVLGDAEQVMILGFGFSRENLALLDLGGSLKPDAQVFASTFRCSVARPRLHEALGKQRVLCITGESCEPTSLTSGMLNLMEKFAAKRALRAAT